LKNYLAIEVGILAGLTAALLGVPDLGGIWVVVPIMVVFWVALQLISSVAFCNAIDKGKIERCAPRSTFRQHIADKFS